MFRNAQRAGVPIDPAAIDRNLADRGLPQQISDNRVDPGLRDRSFFASDCLHASVQLGEGIGRRHNNPRLPLRRIDDEGQFVETGR
jgi:hypothetical protein